MNAIEAARRYCRAGFAPIEIPRGAKNPGRAGWTDERHTLESVAHFNPESNVGVLNGEPSGGLVDVDLDATEAVAVAARFLPATPLVFGRPGKPRSHWLYRCVPPPATTKYTALQDPVTRKFDTLVEIRSTGSQTVWPPSMHPSGEPIAFDGNPRMPAVVPAASLGTAVRALAATVLLARAWPRTVGIRHEVALAAAGYLLRRAVAADVVRAIIGVAAQVAGDDETRSRVQDVLTTTRRLALGGRATGGTRLADLLGAGVVEKLAAWFGPDGGDVWSNGPAAADSGDSGDDSWGEPVSLEAREVPAFPVDALPPVLAEVVRDIARVRQVPPDLPGILVLGVVAAAVARRAVVAVGNTHTEPLNLYVAAVAVSGERKTPAFRDCMRPIYDAQRERLRTAAPEHRAATERRAAVAKRLEHLRTQAARADKATERERLITEAEAIARELPPEPVLPTLVVDDRTPERLEIDLAEQGGAVLLASEEAGTLFAVAAGRYTRDGGDQSETLLRAYDGGRIDTHRITRALVVCEDPALSIIVTPQPIVLEQLREHPALHHRGLLPRFAWVIAPTLCGGRHYVEAKADERAHRAYADVIRQLLDLPRPADAATLPALRLRGAALATWARYANRVEHDLGDGGPLAPIREWASKQAGRVARLAGGLHLVDTIGARGRWVDDIGAAIDRATVVGEYLEAHALRAYDVMRSLPAIDDARRVLAWIERTTASRFSAREAWQALRGQACFATMDDLRAALGVLVDCGHIRPVPVLKSGPGRPPSPVYEVHPEITRKPSPKSPQPLNHANTGDFGDYFGGFRTREKPLYYSPLGPNLVPADSIDEDAADGEGRSQLDALGEALVAQAARRGWRCARWGGARSAGGAEPQWRLFAANGLDTDRQAALAYLEGLPDEREVTEL